MRQFVALSVACLMLTGNLTPVEAKQASNPKSVTVNCDIPNTTLQDAINGATSPTVINFTGTCLEDLQIRVDDLTIMGQTINATIEGSVTVFGGRRVRLDSFTLHSAHSEAMGVNAVDGASVAVAGLIIDGDLGGGNVSPQGVGAFFGSLVRVFGGTSIQNVQTGAIAFGGSVLEFRNASTVEGFTGIGVQAEQGSSARVLESSVILQDGSDTGVRAGRNSVVTIQNSTITAASTNLNGVTDSLVQAHEGSTIRIQGSTITANSSLASNDPAISVLESTARLRESGNTVNNIGGGFALAVAHGGNVIQSAGHTDMTGAVEIGENSTAQFQNVTIMGDIDVFDASFLKLRNLSGNNALVTVNGNVSLSRDSTLTGTAFGGGLAVAITGDLSCDDAESSFNSGQVIAITGTNNCTGF